MARAVTRLTRGLCPAAAAAFQPWLPLAVFAEAAAGPPTPPMPELVRPALAAHLLAIHRLVA